MTQKPTYYEILGLPESLQNDLVIPANTLRGAYKRALLKNHPDKANGGVNSANSFYSIDQISEAYSVLSKPGKRAEYDRELRLQKKASQSHDQEVFRTGIEVVDLDDLEEDETQGLWYRTCRCGDERGFLITEADLEEAAGDGELSVGCRGCSLWLKVLFGVVVDDPNHEADSRKEQRT